MLKHLSLIMLAVCVLGLTGCPELKDLRKQKTTLQAQLERCQQERDTYFSEIAAVQTERDGLKAQLRDAQTEATNMSELARQLREEQARSEKQRQELQSLVRGLAGISVEGRGEGNFIVMENDILFALGKTDLTPEAKTSLDKVAGYLRSNPDLSIRVDGHTDGVPIQVSDWQDNYHLAAMRGHAVMKYLLTQGVEAQRMYIAGFGPNKPRVAPESAAEAVAANRRVEILVLQEGARSISDILKAFEG